MTILNPDAGDETDQSAQPLTPQPLSSQPLTRREAREREAAAAAAASAAPRVTRTSAPRAESTAAPRTDRATRRQLGKRPAPRRAAAPTRPASSTKSFRERTAARLLSFGALTAAGALLVAMSVPANAFAPETSTALTMATMPTDVVTAEAQKVDATAITEEAAAVERDSWESNSQAEIIQLTTGRRSTAYTVDNSGAVRWPFLFAVPISDGYGARVSPCSGCSTQHKGTDFTPGAGAPTYAIADGVVSLKESSSWGLGYQVQIEHVINGQKVTSVYGHMQSGSSDLQLGQTVEAGALVGLVGSTGASTGPHLHFEVHLDGVQVDPFAWLVANTK